jgi:hypothetical protein
MIGINFLVADRPIGLILFSNFGMLREFNEHPGFGERDSGLVVLPVTSAGADESFERFLNQDDNPIR